MAASSLQPLLEGAGRDALLTHILPLLSPHDLGRLAATSRSLRAVVAEAPEAVWQAASQQSHPHQQHPIHLAASCQAYLRRQHAVHAAISSGRSSLVIPHVQTVRLGFKLSPDFSTYSQLLRRETSSPSLQLLDAATQQELARISLPVHDYIHVYFWNQASSRVALRWGAAWSEDEDVATATSTGLCLVQTQTGELSQVDLGLQSGFVDFGGFTPCDSVLVRQTTPTDEWSIIEASGRVQHSAPAFFAEHPRSTADKLVIAPAGTHVASYLRARYADSHFAIWELGAGGFCGVDTGSDVKDICWSPCSKHILSLSLARLQLWDLEGESLFSMQLQAKPIGASWVGGVVVIKFHADEETDSDSASESDSDWSAPLSHLAVHTVQGVGLSLKFLYELSDFATGEWMMGQPQVSPDWQHIAVLVYRCLDEDDRLHRTQLVVLDAGGHVCMHANVPGAEHCLAWSPDGSAICCDMHRPKIVRFG